MKTPKPLPGHFSATLKSFKQKLTKRLPSTTPVLRAQFPEFYTGRKRTIYEQAVKSLLQSSVSRKDSKLKAFVKAEKINFSAKPDAVPRVIQPRDTRYNVEVGRFIKVIEKRIYKAIAWVFGSITVMKGLNAAESGCVMRKKWDRFKHPVALGLDASRMDQHVSVDALDWEHSIYLNCFSSKKDRNELKRLLSWQLKNSGRGYVRDGKIKYEVDGCRMSGDMNTGLGNCLLMCAMIHAFMSEIKVTKYELANNGDDCSLIVEQEDMAKIISSLEDWFLKMGFNMKVEEPVTEFEEIEFCQTKPVWDGESWTMVRNLHTGLAKDCVSLVYNDTINSLFSYYQVLGDAGLHLTGGIPIWQNFYRRLIKCSAEVKFNSKQKHLQHECGMMNLAVRMDRQFKEPTWQSRYSFYKAFGVTPDEQLYWEKHYDEVPIVFRDLKESHSTEFLYNFPAA
jgi:hypothetical protein